MIIHPDEIMNVLREATRARLFTLLKSIIDDEWGPYDDEHYWGLVDQEMIGYPWIGDPGPLEGRAGFLGSYIPRTETDA